MDFPTLLPMLLAGAWLLPLASFVLILFGGRRMGHGGHCAGYLAASAIVGSFVLSAVALLAWLIHHPVGGEHAAAEAISGDWYVLGRFGSIELSIGYYIDSLTIAMFTMVTLVASCIHVYAMGYMHEELHEVTDPLARLENGEPLHRPGRFHRFYQYLSLFCFSMLGLVIAGNLAMVFAFWELVGVCSYFLIGFYIERKSASNAANKAFIVNRVGDFGMIIGLMAVLAGMGTFSFGNGKYPDGSPRPGIFEQVRPAAEHHEPRVPDGMVRLAAQKQIVQIVADAPNRAAAELEIAARLPDWRAEGLGYGLLIVAGLGIFCGCVGKSAQFPLHVWLPDAMEGPTPVSALIHAATMVAAGVYLVGRFYPVFAPEVLLVIACTGCITLFIAATIAITATDIKRVLAYSTVSQLGYMMLALGLGGWLAGLFHLFTHAFFKALLFLCSGSVIHATGTNEMPQMGGLWRKMPWTAGTMLVGCLAIAGAGIPLVIGLSGYYSKDAILAQALLFGQVNPKMGGFFWVATLGASITAFYMFRLWFMTFVGTPRDHHVYSHAHESPPTMVIPLVILAGLAVAGGWNTPIAQIGLRPLLEQARPAGIEEGASAGWGSTVVVQPSEHATHAHEIHVPATFWAFGAAACGVFWAVIFYGAKRLDPEDVRRTFSPVYWFLRGKWYFDELYRFLFVRPAIQAAHAISAVDKQGIDWLVDRVAGLVGLLARVDDWIDRLLVDGLVNLTARRTHALGLRLRTIQTGNLRQYVMLAAVGTVAMFLLASALYAWAG